MFGKRITLAASASLVGISFLFGQAPPDKSTQGTTLPNQQNPAAPAAAPAAPATPVAPGTAPTTPAAPVAPTAPAPNSREVRPAQAPINPTPTTVAPNAVGQQPAPGSNAQNPQQNSDHAQRPMSDDAKFIVTAAEINLAEINIGRLAAQRASRQDIRQFANRLVQDHSANLTQLNQMADRNRWKNGERMDQEHQQLFQKLAGMQGQQFDNEFVKDMVEGHKKAVELFKHASENCKNAEIKQYATQTLAVIRQHEQEAQRLSGQNQPQATQPTSAQDNNNNINRTDGNRTVDTNRNNTNRNDTNRTDPNRRDDR